MRRTVFLSICLGLLLAEAGQSQTTSSSVLGEWAGSYICQGSETGLRLQIVDNVAPNVEARFIFYPTAKNIGVTFGEFMMSGIFDPKNGAIDLKAGGWVKRPLNYVTVDLRGRVSGDGRGMSGTVQYAGCTDFSVTKVP